MSNDDPVLTLEDLPTLRRLAELTRKLSNEYVPDPDTCDTYGIMPVCHRYTAAFMEALVKDLEMRQEVLRR